MSESIDPSSDNQDITSSDNTQEIGSELDNQAPAAVADGEEPQTDSAPVVDNSQQDVAAPLPAPSIQGQQAQPKPDRLSAFLAGNDNALFSEEQSKVPDAGEIYQGIKMFNGYSPEEITTAQKYAMENGVPFDQALSNQGDIKNADDIGKIVKDVSQTDENGVPKFPNTAELLSNPLQFAKWRDKVDQLKAIESVIYQNSPEGMAEMDRQTGTIRPMTNWESFKFNLATKIPNFDRIENLWQGLNRTIELPKFQGKQLAAATGMNETVAKVAAGLDRGVIGAGEFLTSPLGISTMGSSALPKLAQRLISGAFATQMASDIPEVYHDIKNSIASGDPEEITRSLTSGTLQAWFVKQSAKHALIGERPIPTQMSEAPHSDVADMVQQHVESTQLAANDIAKQDNQIKLLTDLKTQLAPETKVEGSTADNSLRDPVGLSDFVEKSLKANGHETEMDIDPNAVHEALFQDAKTPLEIDEAQKKLDLFSEDVGVNPDSINKAIQDGTPFKVNTAKLVGMYGRDPIFDSITKQMQEARDASAENLSQKQTDFEDKLALEKKQTAEPTQIKALRDQMMKPQEQGGAGKSAQEVDDDLKAVLVPLGNIARQRGETLQEAFDRSGLEVKTGEDGRMFVQRQNIQPVVPDDRIKATLESAVEEGRPVSKALADRLNLDLPENYIDYGGFYAKEVKGKALTEDQRATLESQARQEADSMMKGDLSQHEELHDAIQAVGGLLSPKLIKAAGGLGGEATAILDAAKRSPKLFRNDGLSPDKMVEALNARGFHFENEADLLQAVYDRVNQGHKVYAGSEGALFQAAIAEQTKTPQFKNWFGDSKVLDDKGHPLIVYHGSKRVDRIGNEFKKNRATSGPLQYFTDNPDLASSYSIGKEDTSLEHPSDYSGWFKYKGKGMRSASDISRAWYSLTPEEQQTIKDRIYTIGYENHDTGEGKIVPNSESIMGRASIDHELKEAHGNGLKALVNIWLNSGSLFDHEETFMDVLSAAGLNMSKVEFDSPWKTRSGVIPVFLSIKNPLDTGSIPDNVVKALEDASKRKRSKTSAGLNSDAWDKNTISGKDWIKSLHEDLKSGSTHAWTRVPDWVTSTLSSLGYDGIKDVGGKNGGKIHGVWVPFEPTQIKSAIGNRGTFDPNNKNILFQADKAASSDLTGGSNGGTFPNDGSQTRSDSILGQVSHIKPSDASEASKANTETPRTNSESHIGNSVDYRFPLEKFKGLRHEYMAIHNGFDESNQNHVNTWNEFGNFLVRFATNNGLKIDIDSQGRVDNVDGLIHEVSRFLRDKVDTQDNQNVPLKEFKVGGESWVHINRDTNQVYKTYAPNENGAYGFGLGDVIGKDGHLYLNLKKGTIQDLQHRFAGMHDIGDAVPIYIGGVDKLNRLVTNSPFLHGDVSKAEMDGWLASHKAVPLALDHKYEGNLTGSKEVEQNQYAIPGKSGKWYLATDVKPDNFLKDSNGNILSSDFILKQLSDKESKALSLPMVEPVSSKPWIDVNNKGIESLRGLSKDKFNSKYKIHFDNRPDGESRIASVFEHGFTSGMAGHDIDIEPRADSTPRSMDRGWATHNYRDQPGAIAYVINNKDINYTGRPGIKKGAKPVAVVKLSREGQSVFEAIQEGKTFFAGDVNNPRGAFQPINGKDVIHLFKTHDASTFLHEAHHFIVKEYESLINSGLADAQTLKDWNTLLDFVGSKDGKLTTAMHEKIADAGVTYYMEGKAPSPGLIDVFRRFKDRLLQLYKQADGLGIKLSDDVRSVFARWHASESEINQANDFYHLQDVIKNLNDTKFKEKQIASKVEEKTAAHVQAAKEAKLKVATMDVDAMPVYRVLNNDKINLESIRQDFGEEAAKDLKEKFPGTFSDEGLSVHEVAIKRGFESPDALVEALRNALPREEAIKQRHQDLISSKEEALQAKDPTAVTPADEETHTQQSLNLLIDDTNRMQEEASHQSGKEASQARMAAARKGSQQHQLTAKAYRDSARDTLNKMKAGEAAEYYRFAQAEKKFGAQFAREIQKGNTKEALAARMKQLFNHALVVESIKARAEMQQIQNRYDYRKINNILKEGIENEYLSPITTLLSRFGFSNRKVDVQYDWTKIKDLDPVLAAMVPDVVKGQVSGDYRKALTLQELREVDGFAQTLIHVGRDVLRSMKDSKAMSISDFVGESIGNMSKLSDKKFAAEGTKKAWFQKVMEGIGSSTLQQQFLADMADNFSFRTEGKSGVMRRLYETMVNRQVKESNIQKTMAKELDPFFKTLRAASERITKQKGSFFDLAELPLPPELSKVYRGKWTAERLIALMLNTGNEGNLLALKNAYAYNEGHIASAAKLFKGEELKAIQGIWDTINKLYPEIDRAHFETYNRHVPKVEAQALTVKDMDGKEVKLDGGYYPLKFDSEINTQAGKNAETDLMEQYAGVLRSSKPQDGFTQSRTPGHSLPPLLSLDVLGKHIADSVHYATHADIVRDWNKVTANEEWKRSFTDKFGTKNYEETRQWIKDQAQKAPPLPAGYFSRVLEKFFQKQRGIATVAAFGFNVKSGILIHHSLFNAAHALDWKWLASGSRDLDLRTLAGGAGKAWKEIADMSPYMKDHALSWDRDVRAMSEDLKPGKIGTLDKVFRKASSAMGKEFTLQDARKMSMILLTTGHQRMAAMVWKGALNKYMGTMTDAKLSQAENLKQAIQFADGMVQDTQASSLRAELNAVQRDQGVMRFLTAFMSWNFKYGGRLQYEAKAFKEGKITKSDYMSHVILETIAPALVRTALVGAMTASAPSTWDWIKSVPEMITSWIPILKDINKVFPYSSKNHRVDFNPAQVLPIAEGGRRIAKAATSTVQAANGTKDAGPMIWDWARATDYLTGTGLTKPVQDLYKFYENLNSSETP